LHANKNAPARTTNYIMVLLQQGGKEDRITQQNNNTRITTQTATREDYAQTTKEWENGIEIGENRRKRMER